MYWMTQHCDPWEKKNTHEFTLCYAVSRISDMLDTKNVHKTNVGDAGQQEKVS